MGSSPGAGAVETVGFGMGVEVDAGMSGLVMVTVLRMSVALEGRLWVSVLV